MKGEYTDEKHHSNNTTMFTKIHQTQKFPPHHKPSYIPTNAGGHHNFQLAVDQQPDSPTTAKTEPSSTNNDGASIEVVRRPRGRPPGSRNRPKPPVIVTRDTEPSMSPYVLEIPAGSDIVNTITVFCRLRHSGLCILNGSGTITNVTLKQPSTTPGVTLKQPSTTPGATVTFHGCFDILSLSGTIIPSLHHVGNNFTISLAGPQGQIVGGAVVAPLVAAATVYVIAASFNNPAYHRLPIEEDVEQGNNNNNSINNGYGSEASPSAVSGGDRASDGGGGMSAYNLANDVIWAPTPRQPPPPY